MTVQLLFPQINANLISFTFLSNISFLTHESCFSVANADISCNDYSVNVMYKCYVQCCVLTIYKPWAGELQREKADNHLLFHVLLVANQIMQ